MHDGRFGCDVMTQQDVPRWESHVPCAPGVACLAAAAPEEDYSGGSSDATRLESASSLGEEDSDSGSWWSYPSECGSVVELNRAAANASNGFVACGSSKHPDHSEQRTKCGSNLSTPADYVATPSAPPHDRRDVAAAVIIDASDRCPNGVVFVPPSPDRLPKSKPLNGRSRIVSDTAQDYDVERRDNAGRAAKIDSRPFEPAARRASVSGGGGLSTADHHNNQVRAGGRTLPKPESKDVPGGRNVTIRKSALAPEIRHSAPSIVRHVTFKDLSSASSGSDEDDYSSGQGRNRNSASYHGDDQQNNAEGDLDDSGYLDGDSTSSSSDISPPSSLSWESAIDSSSSRKGHGRSPDQRCFVDSGGGGSINGTHSPPGPRTESRAGLAEERRSRNMNGTYRDGDSTLSFVQTEVCVSQSVRREDSYEYYRNGTRIAKLNNVNQTSWSETSSTETTERCTPLGNSGDAEKTLLREQTTPPQPPARASRADEPAAEASAPPLPARRVLPSVDVVRKRQPEAAAPRRQSATRESGKPKKESAGGGVRNVGSSVNSAIASSAANDACQPSEYHRWKQHKSPQHPIVEFDDEGTSCDLEDEEEGDDDIGRRFLEEEDVSVHFESPQSARHQKQRAGTVSATATSRAVARSRGGSTAEPSRASALASVRAQSRDPFLALAVATAKAATTASAEASREIYAGCKQFVPPPDLDVVVRTACSVGGSEDAVDRARHARSQPSDDIVSVSSSPVYRVGSSSARSDVRLPTPVRYKEFSSLHLRKSAGEHANGNHGPGAVSPLLEREPQPCEQRSFHVHSDVLPSRADSSPPTSSTPSPVLLEDRVRVVRTPVKSNAVIVDNIPDSDDCDGPPITTPSISNGHCNNKRPATLPVNGGTGPVCHRKPPPFPQTQKHQQPQATPQPLLRPPKPVPPPRSRSPLDPAEHLERITGYATARRLAQTLPKPQVQLPEPHMSPATGRLVSSRRRFFENLQRQQEQLKRANDAVPSATADESAERLLGFRASAQAARESLAKSSPDLAALEADAWRSRRLHDRWPPPPTEPQHAPRQPAATTEPFAAAVLPPRSPAPAVHPDKFNRLVEQTRSRYARRRCGPAAHDERRRSRSLGYLETDVDTLCCRQVKAAAPPYQCEGAPEEEEPYDGADDAYLNRTRSMDRFLEDGTVGCPLLGDDQRTKSEHELRIERSLQKLELPEWYTRRAKQTAAETGFLRARRDSTSSAAGGRPSWQGLGSRTPSTASLAATTPESRNLVIPKRVTAPDWRCWHASRESLTSSPGSHDGSLSRWGSVSSAPAAAWSYRSMRQPYLGWRAAPSTGTTTPLSSAGSRPVSPGGAWITPSAFEPTSQQEQQEPHRHQSASPCIPRDRYSYVQGIYGDGGGWNVEHEDHSSAVCSSVLSDIGVPPASGPSNGAARPAVWMESSFVGSKPGSTSSVVAAQSPAAPALVHITIVYKAVRQPSAAPEATMPLRAPGTGPNTAVHATN